MGKAGASQQSALTIWNNILHDCQRTQITGLFYPLATCHQGFAFEKPCVILHQLSQRLHRYRQQQCLLGCSLIDIRRWLQRCRQNGTGQVPAVFAVHLQIAHMCLIAPPENHFRVFSTQRDGQCRPKCAGTDNPKTHAFAPFFPLPSKVGLVRSSGQRGRADKSMPSHMPRRNRSRPT